MVNKRARSPDFIDLTQENPPQANRKAPRTNDYTPRQTSSHFGLPSYSASAAVDAQRSSWVDEEDYSFEEVVAPDGTQGYVDASRSVFELYGSLSTKIVGVRFYSGLATLGEMVVLRREPRNPYDTNAIQVQNVQRDQIGHIPKQMAAKLARYMDSKHLLVEGTITGHKGDFDCPIELKLFGTNEPVARLNLMEQMKVDRLPLDGIKAREKAERERAKAAKEAAKQAKKNAGAIMGKGTGQQWELASNGAYSAGSTGPGDTSAEFDALMEGAEKFNPRNVERVIEQFGLTEDDLKSMPMAAQPSTMSAQLLPFQLQGLQWMLDKENPALPPLGSKQYVQCWKRSTSDNNVFTNVVTNYSLRGQLPQLSSGGFLCDDMGLGKTIQTISLIMADRALRKPLPNGVSTATLILAPLSVMSNWSGQIVKHVREEHALNVMTYHGTRKEPISPKTVSKYDVVVTTYETVMAEWFGKQSDRLPRSNGLFSVTWRRIVLDEGHNIRNPNAKRAVATCNLMAHSRWILTGTPIINSLKDLFSLVKFLRLSGGLDRFELFNAALIRPVNRAEEHGNFLLQLLMRGICLRRKKEMKFIDLKLPELSEYVHKIKFEWQEQQKYDALEAEAKGTLEQYRANLGKKSKDSAQEYRHLLEILLRIRQCCNHWKLVGEERVQRLVELLEQGGSVDLTPENTAALQQMLQLSIETQEDCPVCIDNLKDPIITSCGHVFCFGCIERVIETQHKCPMCRSELKDVNSLVKPAKGEVENPKIDMAVSSSKIEALLSVLNASRKKHPDSKSVLFSQWTSFLDVVQVQLQQHGYVFTRIDGSMPALARDDALNRFDTDANCTVLLASLGVCSVGLNLTVANQVIMMDSWWSFAIEDQAVDRVHRLGQTKECRVWRLVMENSIEERVLGIQEDKRKLMALAFAEKVDKAKKRKGLQDIMRLLA